MWQNGVYLLNGNGEFSDKYTTMPTASVGFVGKIVQYTGTTTVNYINGYFYKGIATNMPSVATADITEATGITEATVNKTTFEGELPTSGVYDFIYKEGSATGSVGSSTGVTSATVVKATFEALLATAGAYDFEFTDYLVTASIGASAGITSASVVKATFKSQLSTTGDYVFTYTASTASASIVGSTGISGATVDVAVFETLLATTGDYVFTFDGTDWKYDSNVVTLADYGIVATGTPNLNDVITISYAEDKWEYDSGTVLLSTYGITYEGTPADSDTITISYVEELWEYDGSEVTLADYGITAVGTPADGDIITVTLIVDNWYYLTNIVTLSDYGIVATGTPDYEDTITITYAVAYVAYSWLNINVQAGSAEQVALLSITTAPSGTFAVGSKYYNSSTKKIVTAVTADTWTGATSADPVFNTIYTFNSGYYIWDGNSLELTDLNLYEKVANKTDSYTETSPTKYPSSKALSDGLGSVVVPNASTTVKGINQIATDTEVVTGTDEIKTINAKQLKDRGAEFEQTPFTLQEDVLSSNVNKVVSNSKFFFFGNGNVSTDGKTVIKQTASFNADFSMTCNENYVVCNHGVQQGQYFRIAIWKIGIDGTLTFIREFARANGYNNTQILNGVLFVTSGVGGGGSGLYYLDEADFETETAMTFITGQAVTQVAYDNDTEQYIIFREDGVQISNDISDIYTKTLLTFTGGFISGGKMLEGKLTVYISDWNNGNYFIHQTVIGSGTINTITLPIALLYQELLDLQKVADKYILIVRNGSNGVFYYYIALALTSFNADSDGVGYALANVGTNYAMVTNTKNVLLSGEARVQYVKDVKVNGVSVVDVDKVAQIPITSQTLFTQTADKTIANTDVETSVINTTAGEYIGSNVIPANSLTAGDVISIKAKGIISTASSAPTTTLKAKLGSVVLIESSGALPTDWDGVYFELNAEITIRAIGATGKAIIGGNTLFKDSTTISAGIQRILKGAEVEINTTINNTLDLTYTWSAASADNTITVKQAHFEIKKHW